MLKQLNHKQIMDYISKSPVGTEDDLSKAAKAQFDTDVQAVQNAIDVIEARNCSGRLLGITGEVRLSDKEWQYFKSQLFGCADKPITSCQPTSADLDSAAKSTDLHDFKKKIPPWTSYCRSCLRRAGFNPYVVRQCPSAAVCVHYPFKYRYHPKPK